MISFFLLSCSEPEVEPKQHSTVELPIPTLERHQFESCEQEVPPVLALHGFLASGDTYLSMEHFFIEHGWCPGSFRVLDWNSLSQERLDVIEKIDAEIIDMLETYETEQIILIGHSAGGGLSLDYLDNSLNHEKIAAYIHLASFPIATPEDIPMLNIYSSADKVVSEATEITSEEGDLEHITNVNLEVLDHFEVATNEQVFSEIKDFLDQEVEINMEEQSTPQELEVRGTAVYFGDNEKITGADITVYKIEDAVRTTSKPLSPPMLLRAGTCNGGLP